jgi:hypothetical protein
MVVGIIAMVLLVYALRLESVDYAGIPEMLANGQT